MENRPRFIIIHTSDVPFRLVWNQLKAINRYHRLIDFPRSKKGYYVGYHRLITGDKNYQCREDLEVGAHCNTKLFDLSLNYQSLGICVGFDGDEEYMSAKHFKLLQEQVWAWQDYWKIDDKDVRFHREFNKFKTCPGKLIDQKFLNRLLKRHVEIKTKEQETKRQAILKQLTWIEQVLARLQRSLYLLANK